MSEQSNLSDTPKDVPVDPDPETSEVVETEEPTDEKKED